MLPTDSTRQCSPRRPANLPVYDERIPNDEKLTLISQREPGIYVFAQLDDGRGAFEDLAARVMLLAVKMGAYDVQIDLVTTHLRMEMRPGAVPSLRF